VKPRVLSARAVDLAGELCGSAQQLLQYLCAKLMGSGARGHFDSLQIETATLAPAAEYHFQQRGYFPLRLALDRFGRFFSWGDNESSTGRARQILSFTSSSS
jgi:hypothetical protein